MDLNGGTLSASSIADRNPHSGEKQRSYDPWNLTGDFYTISTPPTDLEHPPMGSRMFHGKRLSQDVCPLKMGKCESEVTDIVPADRCMPSFQHHKLVEAQGAWLFVHVCHALTIPL